MKFIDDVQKLVADARRLKRASMTMAGFLRMNLFYSPCHGWLLVTQVVNPAMREHLEVGSATAAAVVHQEINRTGDVGKFGTPCREGEALVFRWEVSS